MTAAEVREAVALLGFNPELSDEEEHARFWMALNMAIPMLAQFAPMIRQREIAHFPITPSYYVPTLAKPYGSEAEIEVPSAAAIYLEVIGTGRAQIVRDGMTYEVSWSGETAFRPMRYVMREIGLGDGDAHIRFLGEYAYTVRAICGYDSLTSSDPDALLPPREWISYDMSELCSDFGEFAPEAPDMDAEGASPTYRITSRSVIEVSAKESGVLRVFYKAKPRAASADHENEQIDVEVTLHHLIPLLVSHYLWMDDEPEKAAQYKANYDEQLALWRARAKATENPRVINVTGW